LVSRRDFLKIAGGAALVATGATATWQIVRAVFSPASKVSRLPILVVTAGASGSSDFGDYLGEMLRTEGLGMYNVTDLPSVSHGTLNSFELILLAEISRAYPLSPNLVGMLEDFLKSGGALIAIRPPSELAEPIFGVKSTGKSIGEGYVKFDTQTSIGRGLGGVPLQYHGEADAYEVVSGETQVVATLHQDSSKPTSFPAVAQRGRAVIFAYNLAKSVVLLRQGDPSTASQEHDGYISDNVIRPSDMFLWLDATRAAIPQADLQQRSLANAILALSTKPLPRLWYFPNQKKSVLITTGDQDGATLSNGTGTFYQEMQSVEARGGHLTYYLLVTDHNNPDWPLGSSSDPGEPIPLDPSIEQAWRARGHDMALHVTFGCIGGPVPPNDVLSKKTSEQVAFFLNRFGHAPRTVRTACLVWSGWVEEARVLAQNGIRIDLNYVSLLFFSRGSGGEVLSAMPYMAGTAFPQKFVDQSGTVLNIFQQPTMFEDDVVNEAVNTLGIDPFQLVMETLDEGIDKFHEPLILNNHPALFAAYSREWLEPVLAHAKLRDVPILSAGEWLDFWDGRYSANFTDLSLDVAPGGSAKMSFKLDMPLPLNGLTVVMPSVHLDKSIAGVSIDGKSYMFTQTELDGSSCALFVVENPGIHDIAVTYGS
jgi:hypothetical protein